MIACPSCGHTFEAGARVPTRRECFVLDDLRKLSDRELATLVASMAKGTPAPSVPMSGDARRGAIAFLFLQHSLDQYRPGDCERKGGL